MTRGLELVILAAVLSCLTAGAAWDVELRSAKRSAAAGQLPTSSGLAWND